MRFISRRSFCVGAAVVLLAAITATVASAQHTTTVILVRHAEKAAEPAADPPLDERGKERALALADVTRDAGVTAVITTQWVRTRATAAPLAAALGLTPEVVETRGREHAQDVARAVMRHTGGTVLVVGHSNTVPAIVQALGAPRPPEICDSEYDHLFVVTVREGSPARVLRLRFGAQSPQGVGCAGMKD